MNLGISVFLLLVGVTCVLSGGHLEWDCETLLPTEYVAEPQDWEPPYRIDVYPTYFEPGSQVQVEIRGMFNTTFEGFVLQARRAEPGYGPLEEAIGQFNEILPPPDTQLLDCAPGTKNAWAHGDDIEKFARIIHWTAPTHYEGPIVFTATIIHGPDSVYWTNVKSPVVNSLTALHCYECYYTETNGVADPDRDNKEACYYFPWAVEIVNCADSDHDLLPGYVYRCYTSEWKHTAADGEVVIGIRRGCTQVDANKYGDVSTTSDITDIQEIFFFTLDPGDQQIGTADLCRSPICNDEPSELQCYTCKYTETNGVPRSYDDKYNCFYDPSLLDFEHCDEPLQPGYIHRCYTSVSRKITRDGDFEQGIRRGCVAVHSAQYGSVASTSDINDVQEIFDFQLLEGDVQTGTADFCDSDFCNDEPSELTCYQCKYTETNGVADPNRDNKQACYYYPWLLDIVNCKSEEGPLELGEIYRCYSSIYKKFTVYGDTEEGIRRGCVAVQRYPYAILPSTSDIDEIQEIFDFTLPPGDVQTGTAEFCDTDHCNDDDAGLQCHECYYSDTNGITDHFITDHKDTCYNHPSLTDVVNCVDEQQLLKGQIHRCYTSEWHRIDANGDIRDGVRRGCIAVDESPYGTIPWTTDVQDIETIFNFRLGPGDRQTGTTDFCDWDECNDEYLYQPKWNPWGPYTEYCTRTCGGGTRTRTRTCDDPRPGDNAYCEGHGSESIACNTHECPIDPNQGQPVWSYWTSWGLCSVTCGYSGSRARTRVCIDPVADDVACEGHDYETTTCNLAACPDGGMWTTWSSWGGCSSTCGYGERVRTRSCLGSDSCYGDYYETDRCELQPCDLQWTAWTSWSRCSARCGRGERQRTRSCYDSYDRCDGSTRETEVCIEQDCEEGGDDGLEIGAVIGIILGVLAFLVICVVVVLVACWIGSQPPRPRPGYIFR